MMEKVAVLLFSMAKSTAFCCIEAQASMRVLTFEFSLKRNFKHTVGTIYHPCCHNHSTKKLVW